MTTDQPADPRVAFRQAALAAIPADLIYSPAVGAGVARRYMLADAMWPAAEPLLADAYDRGLTQGLMHAVEHVSRLLGHEVVLHISREAAEGMLASALDTAREAGRRQAAEAVRAQASLPDLVHFDRPSDFRKGVLSCLAALEAQTGGPDAA